MTRVRRGISIALATVPIVGGVAVAAALPAGAAVNLQSPSVAVVQIGSPGVIEARGAAVTVPIAVVCEPGATGDISAQVTERSGGAIASAGTYVSSIVCTGSLQKLDVTLIASAGGKPFRNGTAFASAEFFVYANGGSIEAQDQREIQLKKA